MFGHQDDQDDHHHDDQPVGNVLSEPVADGLLTHEDHITPIVHEEFNPALPASDSDQPGSFNSQSDFALPVGVSDSATAHTDEPAAVVPAEEPVVADVTPATPVSSPANNDLLSIKQQALTQLTPLVDQLDQSPEEKFRTTMMMIQAADNQALVSKAYEAAQAISDEKVKAQALLDIVNEINYFTTQAAA